MEMITMKTADLTGAALDWAVAKSVYAVEFNTDGEFGQATGWLVRLGGHPCVMTGEPVWVWYKLASFKPSTDWSQGGPLLSDLILSGFEIARCLDMFACANRTDEGIPYSGNWDEPEIREKGQTPLVAACRAIVAAKLGETVDVPEVLV